MRYVAVNAMIIDDMEAMRQEVARVRRAFEREGWTLPWYDQYNNDENDRIVYLMHVCFGSDIDMQEFYTYLIRRTVPSEEGVQAHIATFRPAEG